MYAETVTGYIGQIFDEGEYDRRTQELLQELYDLAVKELEEGEEY